MTDSSGLTFRLDATKGETRFLDVQVEIEPPFTKSKLELKFPRWVPGSYFIREPMQYLTDITCIQGETSLKFVRKDVDAVSIKHVNNKQNIVVNYKILGIELSVRSTHIDNSHLHMMPPFTFLLPTSGIDDARMNLPHNISLHAPSGWTPATQLTLVSSQKNCLSMNSLKGDTYHLQAGNRDELLDGIIETNARDNISFSVDGRTHILKLWDSGGYQPDEEMVTKFVDDMIKVVKEYHALFQKPDWGDYVVILQLTESSRGGLEHLNSQTSMLPRNCLISGHEDEYRDLVSLFSHEYLHQWNVKRLRPKNFVDYDLQQEVHTTLLWWFEGCTSWLGDMLCVRSGAWSEEDWRKDMERKLGRHTVRNGMAHESLAESSHDAWIHLYRSHSFSREIQISYYLEGELAIFCIDAELRKRSKGKYGICDLMVRLCEKYAIGYPNVERIGIDYQDIRKELVSMEGGRNLGMQLDKLIFDKQVPDLAHAFDFYGLELSSKKSTDDKLSSAWLGLNLAVKNNRMIVTSHQNESPLRNLIMPGDELISINKIRLKTIKSMKSILSNLEPEHVELCYTHEGIVKTDIISLRVEPDLKSKVSGKGNKKWRDYISSRI